MLWRFGMVPEDIFPIQAGDRNDIKNKQFAIFYQLLHYFAGFENNSYLILGMLSTATNDLSSFSQYWNLESLIFLILNNSVFTDSEANKLIIRYQSNWTGKVRLEIINFFPFFVALWSWNANNLMANQPAWKSCSSRKTTLVAG